MFSSEVNNDINFFINNEVVLWHPSHSEDEIIETINSKDKFIFYTNQEVYSDNLNLLINLLDTFPQKKIYISQPTTTPYKYSLSPIVNLLHFANKHELYYNPMKEDVVWQLGKYDKASNIIGYFQFSDKRHYENILKSKKGIISVRKANPTRDAIFNKIDSKKFEGIFRYIRIPSRFEQVPVETFTDYEYNLNKNPSTTELVKEYCKSLVSFIIETDSENAELNPITEKTLLGFMTKTLPVVYGGKNFVKELKNMGFYTFNEELGFNTDELDYGDSHKVDNFVEMINTYNQLSYSDIENLYKKNYTKIKKNYDMIWQLFSK